MAQKLPYKQWKERVAKHLIGLCGCEPNFLPDYNYRAAYNSGMGTIQAADDAMNATMSCNRYR